MNEIHVLMIGGKRCGKTTVLASMKEETAKALAATTLTLTLSDTETERYLNDAIEVITDKMSAFDAPLTRIEVDENPTSAERICTFQLSGAGVNLPIYFHDIPGEWLEDEHMNDVVNLVKISQVIMIAIDTPYLFSKMTTNCYGEYHEEYNRPELVTNFFKNAVSTDDLMDRMVLFVPIKCERYFHLTETPRLNIYYRNYMQDLKDAVGAGYRELIIYLRSAAQLEDCCTLAITPILSAGGIDFIRFRTDEQTGKLVSLYQKPEFLPESESGYHPRFCEQPMIYALVHILSGIARQSTGSGVVKTSLFGRNPHSAGQGNQLKTAVRTLQKKLKRNRGDEVDDGYFIIQNAEKLLRDPFLDDDA